jgi:TRAP-type C4-dicarboxylate transport system permease large subunit
MIFLLLIGAMIFNSFMTTAQVNITMGNFISQLELNRYIILAAVLVVYIVAGFFIDMYAILLVTLPITFPIITHLGFDPVLFGVLCVFTVMIGCITPPVGVVTFTVAAMARDVPLYKIFRGCAPYVVTMAICLPILVAFPQISLVLPNMMLPYR